MQVAIDRADACASWVAEKQRPATSSPSIAPRQEAPVGDPVHPALADVLPRRVAAGAVVLDRRAAQGDLVGEPAPAEDVLAGQPVVAVDAPALPHPDRGRRGDDDRALEARDAVAQEAVVLEDLAAALDLGRR